MYVVARTKSGRPSLMHMLSEGLPSRTLCGLDITAWSRAYFDQPIPQILCYRCQGRRRV